MLKIARPSSWMVLSLAAPAALLLVMSAPLYSQEVPEVDDAPAPAAQTKAAPPKIELKLMPSLLVTVEGLDPEKGSVEVSVFNSTESFMLQPFRQNSGVPDAEGKYQIRFVNMPQGEYGIVVVHDVNGNGKYDAGLLGFGAEPVGYSNDAKPWLGRPAFEAVSFEVEKSLEVTIHLE
jgi:uncharacterized protein (DUF2141 family)